MANFGCCCVARALEPHACRRAAGGHVLPLACAVVACCRRAWARASKRCQRPRGPMRRAPGVCALLAKAIQPQTAATIRAGRACWWQYRVSLRRRSLRILRVGAGAELSEKPAAATPLPAGRAAAEPQGLLRTFPPCARAVVEKFGACEFALVCEGIYLQCHTRTRWHMRILEGFLCT